MTFPAVFLDRDGTLNIDVGYPSSIEQIQLIPGAVEAVRQFNRQGYKVIVVTNQSGVARGFMSEARVQEINRAFIDLFAASQARIDAIYYCPHHPDHGPENYRKRCRCRKPEPEMFLRAQSDHQIDFSRSWMIGDKYSDVEAGHRLGMTTILVLTGAGQEQLEEYGKNPAVAQPDFIAGDIAAAAKQIPHPQD